MNHLFLKLYTKFQGLKYCEEGQDLVEYFMLIALIAVVCAFAVGRIASAINSVFSNMSTSLS